MVANAETEERSEWAGWCEREEAAAAETQRAVLITGVREQTYRC